MTADLRARREWRDCIESKPEIDPNLRRRGDWPETEEKAEQWVNYGMNNYGCPFAWLLYDFTSISEIN